MKKITSLLLVSIIFSLDLYAMPIDGINDCYRYCYRPRATHNVELEAAIRSSDEESVKRLLLDPRCNVNQFLGDDILPLSLAANYAGNLSIVRLLIEHGASVNGADRLQYDFDYLCYWRQTAAQREIEKNLKDKDCATRGFTPLHHAAFFNCVEIAKELIRRGADPHLMDNKKAKPLSHAHARVRKELKEYIKNLNCGLNLNLDCGLK